MRVLPWLTLGATLLFAFGKKLAGGRQSVIEHETSNAALAATTLFQLAVAVYGGYFGGGMGIVMLAMLAVLGMTDIHAMNALKSVLGFVINGVAVVTFIVARRGVLETRHHNDRRRNSRRIPGRTLRPEDSAALDPNVCGAGGRGHDGVFLLEVVLNISLNISKAPSSMSSVPSRCHPEQREGPGFLLTPPVRRRPGRTKVPCFA